MFNIQRHCFKFMNLIIIILQFMLKRLNSIKLKKGFSRYSARDRCQFFHRGCNVIHYMFLVMGNNFLISFFGLLKVTEKIPRNFTIFQIGYF